jgi:WS/DGAT/MGAT family acyltransferase
MSPDDAQPLVWGVRREMSPMEELMWRNEADPRLRGTIVALEILDRSPDWDRFWAAHEWGSRVVRRARERVVEPALGIGAPVWAVDPDFDLEYHVSRIRLPSPGSLRQLLDAAQEIAARPFDPERPPWEAVLIEGFEGDRAGYVLKMHHSATDGIGGTQLMERMHGRTREPTLDKAQADAPAPDGTSPRGLAAGRLLRLPVGAVRRLPAATSFAARALRHPAGSASDTAAYVASLLRVAGSGATSPSPLLRSRSHARRFEVLELPLDDLRRAAKRAGGSVNDAFLAAVCDGVGRYHRHFGMQLEELPIGIPVSIRREGNPLGGNHFAGVKLSAPVGDLEPAERIARIRELVLTVRAERALDALNTVAPLLTVLPTSILVDLNVRMARGLDIQASNVPGIAHPVYLAGARVTHWYPFAPAPGIAAMIVLMSHDGTCCIGINLDPAAVTEPEIFRDALVAGFDSILSTLPVPADN